jgi:hypothetical protein
MDVTSLMTGTAVKAIVAYITDYISKTELCTTTMHEAVQIVLQRCRDDGIHGCGSEEDHAKVLLIRMINRLTMHQEIGSPMAAMYVLGNPDHYTNVDFVSLFWKQFVQYLLKDECDTFNQHANDGDATPDDTGGFMQQKVSIVQKENGRFAAYNVAMDDYIYCSEALESESVYTYTLKYRK